MPRFLFAALLVMVFMCSTAKASDITDVSLIQLIANPEKYDGLPVRVFAFLHLEFEGDALYLHQEDYKKSLPMNAVWIALTDGQTNASKKFSGGYVLVEGTFSAKERGHFGMFAGSIQQVTRIQSWERRRK